MFHLLINQLYNLIEKGGDSVLLTHIVPVLSSFLINLPGDFLQDSFLSNARTCHTASCFTSAAAPVFCIRHVRDSDSVADCNITSGIFAGAACSQPTPPQHYGLFRATTHRDRGGVTPDSLRERHSERCFVFCPFDGVSDGGRSESAKLPVDGQ